MLNMLKVIVVALGLSMLIACGDSTTTATGVKVVTGKESVSPVVDGVYESMYDGKKCREGNAVLGKDVAEHKCKIIDWLDKNHNYAYTVVKYINFNSEAVVESIRLNNELPIIDEVKNTTKTLARNMAGLAWQYTKLGSDRLYSSKGTTTPSLYLGIKSVESCGMGETDTITNLNLLPYKTDADLELSNISKCLVNAAYPEAIYDSADYILAYGVPLWIAGENRDNSKFKDAKRMKTDHVAELALVSGEYIQEWFEAYESYLKHTYGLSSSAMEQRLKEHLEATNGISGFIKKHFPEGL